MKKRKKILLSPDEPGLDFKTKQRRTVLQEFQLMSPEEIFQLAVDAGIYDADGNLTKEYASNEQQLNRCVQCLHDVSKKA